jgi:hypothetical protein
VILERDARGPRRVIRAECDLFRANCRTNHFLG